MTQQVSEITINICTEENILVETQCCFNVSKTSIRRWQRGIDVLDVENEDFCLLGFLILYEAQQMINYLYSISS